MFDVSSTARSSSLIASIFVSRDIIEITKWMAQVGCNLKFRFWEFDFLRRFFNFHSLNFEFGNRNEDLINVSTDNWLTV